MINGAVPVGPGLAGVDLRNVTEVKAVPDRGTRRLVLDTKDGRHHSMPLRGCAVDRADADPRPGVFTGKPARPGFLYYRED